MTNSELAAEIRKNIIGLVATPENLEDWLSAQPKEMPTAIAALVGYNYAIEQLATKISDLPD